MKGGETTWQIKKPESASPSRTLTSWPMIMFRCQSRRSTSDGTRTNLLRPARPSGAVWIRGRAGEHRAGLRRELDIQHQPRPAGCVQTGDIGHSPAGRPGRNHPGCHAQWTVKKPPSPLARGWAAQKKYTVYILIDMSGGCQYEKIHTSRI